MKALVILVCSLLLFPMVSAQEVQTQGINPDSLFYGFDLFFEKVQLAFANEQSKINLQLKFAEERIDEFEQMAKKQNEIAWRKALVERERIRNEIGQMVDDLEDNQEDNALKEEVKSRLELQTKKMEMIGESLSSQIRNELSLEIKNNDVLKEKTNAI